MFKVGNLVPLQSNGTWITYYGTCQRENSSDILINDVTSTLVAAGTGKGYYCEYGKGPTAVTSNGGVSRCNS